MIPVDAGFVYPKTGLDADLRFDTTPRFVSTGSLYLPGGSTDDVEVDGLSWTSDGAWSFSCWVKSNDLTSGSNKKFFSVHASGNSHRIDFQASSDTDLQILLYNSSTQPFHTFTGAATRVQDGTWHHVALVATESGSDNVYKIYIDGQQLGADSSALARSDISSADSGYLGNIYTGSGAALTGSLAHVGFWNAALDEAQVRSLMTATTYAEAVTKGGSTPRAYFLFQSNATDSVGAITYTNTSSTAGGLGGSAAIDTDRVRLPNGLDLSGNRRDARSASGRCVDFDGTGDGLRGTTTFDINGSGDTTTLSCWFNADSLSGTNTTIVGNTKANASNSLAIYRTGTNEIAAIAVYAASTNVKVSTGSVLTSGRWYHVATTFDKDSATIKLYVDGKEYSATPSLAYGGSDNTFEIGYRYNSGSPLQAFSGKIADVKLFDIAFTAAQALEQYRNPEQVLPTGASASNLKRFYALSDYSISGANNLNALYVQDASGNGKHLLADNCGMAFNEPAPAPQLGLRSSSSRVLVNNASGKQASATLQSAPGTTYSVSCWFMEMANDDTNVLWRLGGTTATDDDFLELYINSSGVLQVYGDGAVSAGSPTIGEWHHVVVVSDGSSPYCKVYVDNSEITTSGALGQAADISTATLIIGDQAPTLSAFPFDGIISEVAVWDSALTSGNVSTLYASGVQGADANTVDGGNLLNWYKCDNPVSLTNLSDNSTHVATYAASDQNMATIPEAATAGSSAWGSLTNLRPPNGVAGVPGVYATPGRNSAWLPAPAWGTDPFTITYWFYSAMPLTTNTRHFWSGVGDPQVTGGPASTTTINMVCYASAGTGNVLSCTTASSSELQDRWVFVCCRKHSNTSWEVDALPLDGTAVNGTATTDVSGSLTSTSAYGLRINGGHTSDSDPWHRGTPTDIMNFRVWQGEAITDAQMSALYESGARIARGLTR